MQAPDIRARLILEATVSPTEDPSKVAGALQSLAGPTTMNPSFSKNSVRAVTDDPRVLTHIRDQLRDRHVRGAARKQLLANATRRATSLMLNRQAATVGVLAICGSASESPLGPVYLTIESGRLTQAIDWLTDYQEG